MGLLSFLKSDKPNYRDKVWKTKPVAVKGMITDALIALKHDHIPVVFCSFEETLSETISFLASSSVPYFHVHADFYGDASAQRSVVFVCDASLITSSSGLSSVLHHVALNNTMEFLFAGHYPLPAKETKYIEKLSSSYPKSTITFYSSLDDPSFESFGGDRIVTLLDQLGLKEDECIEHPMVTKSMANARAKIESKVTSEIAARSEEEWFLKNVKK